MKRQILYHCTQDDHGPELHFERRTPRFPSANEPETPRLCVSPWVVLCLSSSLPRPGRPVFAYRTTRPIRGVNPVGVWDSYLTRERWIVNKMTLEKFAVISPEATYGMSAPFIEYYSRNKKPAGLFGRMSFIVLANESVGPFFPFSDSARILGFCDFMLRKYGEMEIVESGRALSAEIKKTADWVRFVKD